MATSILTRGIYAGGRQWQHVASALSNLGHRVFSPNLARLGEIEEIRPILSKV
jgi:hypothetical protein